MQCHYLLIKQLANLTVDKIHKLTQECKDLVPIRSKLRRCKKTVQNNLKIVLLFKIEL